MSLFNGCSDKLIVALIESVTKHSYRPGCLNRYVIALASLTSMGLHLDVYGSVCVCVCLCASAQPHCV